MDDQLINISKIQLYEKRQKLLHISYIDVLINFTKVIIYSYNENLLMMYVYLICCIFTYIGQIGITRYLKSNIYFYMNINALVIMKCIFYLLFIDKSIFDVISSILLFFMISIIFKLNLNYIRSMANLRHEDIEDLKNGWTPPRYRFSYII